MAFTLRIPGQPPLELGPQRPSVSLGRSPRNDVVVDDPSISRHHARLEWRDGGVWVQDLGSMNGTKVNGRLVRTPARLAPRDALHLGNVQAVLEGTPVPGASVASVFIDSEVADLPNPTLVVPAASLREPAGERAPDPPGTHLLEALQLVSEVTLELLQDTPLERHLELLLERLCAFLKPSRGAVMLRAGDGALDLVAVHGREESSPILLSRTVVDAALERREAMLLNDLAHDARLASSESLILSGVTSVMTTPLEYGGHVVGLLYMDARRQRQPFTREDLRLLTSMAHVAAAKIQTVRLQEEVATKRAMEQEVALARQIQERLLPSAPPRAEGHEVIGLHQACQQVSGDLYGYWPGHGGKLLFAVADVVGKGVGPGLLMASLQAYVGAWADLDLPLGELARKLSATLAGLTTANRFITAFLGRLDPATGEVEYTNAGHPAGLLLTSDGGLRLLPSGGLPLAVFPREPYPVATLHLRPGDLLALYTDGLTEATDDRGREYGADRLGQALADHARHSLEDVAHRVLDDLERFTAASPLSDDRTLLLLRRRP